MKKIYLKLNTEKNELLLLGISLKDILLYLKNIKIEHYLVIKGDYIGEKVVQGFEIVDHTNINALIDSFKYGGSLVLVDFQKDLSELKMSDSDIMELLYTAHLWEVYKNSYFESLNNRIILISHDDSWHMKIYFNDIKCLNNTIFEILKKQVSPIDLNLFEDFIHNHFFDIIRKGVFVGTDKNKKILTVRNIGIVCHDMDDVENKWEMGVEQEIFNFGEK